MKVKGKIKGNKKIKLECIRIRDQNWNKQATRGH